MGVASKKSDYCTHKASAATTDGAGADDGDIIDVKTRDDVNQDLK